MSEDHRQEPPPEANESREATVTAGESSSQHRSGCGLRQALRKVKKNVTKKVSKRFKRSRRQIPAVQNTDHEGASSNQNIEDASCLPSNGDKPTTSENLKGCVNEGVSGESALKVLDAPLGVEEILDPQSIDAEFRGAHEAENGPKGLTAADDFLTTHLQSLKNFDTVIEDPANVWAALLDWKLLRTQIDLLGGALRGASSANVHPYAKMVLGMLSAASKIILAQTEHDQSVQSLLEKLEQVYGFMSQDDTLGQISSKHSIAGRITQQTMECACFIRDYSEKKSFWKRLGKNVASETDDLISRYNKALNELMQQFRDQALRDQADLVRYKSDELGDRPDLSGMPYAAGAGLNTAEQCISGTRTSILSQITEWINVSGDTAQRVLWLSGPAGTGKSYIAHTIAKWFNDAGGLANAVEHENALKNTSDIIQQWRKLFMEPLKKCSRSSVGPVLIVIEALDKSGEVATRRNLLRILAGTLEGEGLPKITELPSNFQILVTSRALPDINSEFQDAPHIQRLSMDDISEKDSKRDIHTFVSYKLKKVSGLGNKEFAVLADKSDGLFEWARLACRYIQETPFGSYPIDCFNAVVTHDHGERKNLLYDLYRVILAENMGKDRYTRTEYQQVLAKFHSVMGQVLGSAKPLPLDALNAMRSRFPDQREHYKVEVVIERMGSLLSGITNPSSPIRPLHASFREFLTDKSSSGDFFLEISKSQHDLAFASLRVMEQDLRFNMCNLKSSYLPNSKDIGLLLQASVTPTGPPALPTPTPALLDSPRGGAPPAPRKIAVWTAIMPPLVL
ncbi:uncharacterized protein F5147DRAFT_820824 [Suillus discolor]|uniref:Parvovirus non-structural protein 1 helicase domain-containing protein n=1 Tax=Suillus discolor TaxID=1912936 RepID=A0A9P7JNY0_9AGAM|nr:uncharacterized protein F5147DRAFT_820824 [Suillus discolor]KAG2093906.1 hypothetical protein F5147DRAFT_820824 [Suillus discolor]